MNIAVSTAEMKTTAAIARGPVAHIQLFDDLSAAEPFWRALERQGAVHTPYQRYEWIALWRRHVAARRGLTPFIVVGSDAAGEPLFLWPLVRSQRGPCSVATYFGGKHANFNFALWRRDYASALTAAEVSDLLGKIAVLPGSVDFLMLFNQPVSWEGLSNPFALLPHQPSPSAAYRLRLGGSGNEVLGRLFSDSMRARLRGKERKLQQLSGYRFYRAETAAEVDRLFDSFFAQKNTRFSTQGIRNVFVEPGVEGFIRDAGHSGLASGRPVIELYAIECDSETLALRAGVKHGGRFSCMFNSFTVGEHARHSPGQLLTSKVVADCADRGLEFFDLGVGEAYYKNLFCNEVEPLFDSFLPLTPLGRLAAATARAAYAVKGRIKRTPALWTAVQVYRRLIGRWR
jgi:CelD/BcsL family acetyltransferase involved in cellulose biosynthesis